MASDTRYSVGQDDIFYTAHPINRIRIPVDIFRQGNSFFIPKICNERIFPILIHKAETVNCIDISKPAGFVLICPVPLLIDQFLSIISNLAIISTPDSERQIAQIGHLIQPAAAAKCTVPDARHTIRNHNARQTAAILKYTTSYARHTARNHNARQTAAILKYTTSYARHTARNHNAHETAAPGKRGIPDARQLTSLFKYNRAQICLTRKDTADICHRRGNNDFCNNIRHKDDLRFGFIIYNAVLRHIAFIIEIDGDIKQAAAPGKSGIPDARNSARN